MIGRVMRSGFYCLCQRDFILAYRFKAELSNPLLFFIIVVSLFPLAITPDPQQLSRLAPGVIWVAALLATLLSLDSLFRSDYDDGALEQILLSPTSDFVFVLAKVLVHWLVTGFPLILLAPLLALLLHLTTASMWVLMLSLVIGTPVLSLIGAIGMALTVSLRKGGVLVALLVLPLYIPVLIFGTSAVSSAALGLPYAGQLLFLTAFLLLALSLAPMAIAAALRVGVA